MFTFFVFLLGIIFGSFANVVIYRVPRKLSIAHPPSACPFCGKRLSALELIPLFSWLFLRGKCRDCKGKISARYPLVELLCGVLFAAMEFFAGFVWLLLPLCIFAFVLLTISFIDFDTQEIPDGLVITGAVAGVAWVVMGGIAWYTALLGMLAGALPLLVIDRITLLLLKKDGFGYGDVKLMAMVGLFIGWGAMLVAFFAAFAIGAAFAVYLMASGKVKRGAYIAFGPFLCVGSLVALWFGDGILGWYLSLLRPF
ncbi:MAG: prepilin peptidase [Defluviitaleaceae bacterium]|nr:prepilin peptidase [Defluviitaleaceae bacterium]